MKSLLIVNAGSSSLKFALFRLPILENSQSVFRGQVDGIGADTKFVVKDADGKVTSETAIAKQSAGGSAEAEHQAALDALLNWLDSQSI
ncbi:MAG TPA: acetate kinase, partial [Rhodocyclaceae bacterium]|nr:acetate kinase [Rhodocyclaceae bacterium]